MARRGRFGRVPRTAPNLTNTLVAIAREMQSRRDQNLMDAWAKGGLFEGSAATDERVLAHWRNRVKNVDKKDPLFDAYQNNVTQLEYAIAESKASTEYAQGKRTDAQMAKFYLDWAKKVPVNTEFYRVLQRDGAQFLRASRAKGAANAQRAKEQAYYDSQNATAAKYEKAGQYLSDTFRALAQANALIGMSGNTDVTDFDPSDPAVMLRLIGTINGTTSERINPDTGERERVNSTSVLYHDQITGLPVTGADILAKLKTLDPNFSGAVSVSYYSQMLRRQITGQQIRYDLATSTGHATDANNAQKDMAYTAELGREARAWPVERAYLDLRQQFLNTWQSPTATPDTKLAAWNKYAAGLTGLAQDKKQPLDDATKNRIMAEVDGNDKVPSLAEDFTGLGRVDLTTPEGSTGVGDIAQTHFDLQRYVAMQDAVNSGAAYWTTGTTDKAGVFHPVPGGKEIGAASPQDIEQASPLPFSVIFVPQEGAAAIPVVATGIPVTASATNADGKAVNAYATGADSANKQIATAYEVSVNGITTRVFSYKDADGRTYYTSDAPWSGSIPTRVDSSGIHLDLSSMIPQSAEGLSRNSTTDPITFKVNADGKTGEIVFNPAGLAFATTPERALTAGPDPATDFFSPTLAALMSSPDGQKTLNVLSQDANFVQQLDREARQSAGFSQDATGAWVGGDEAAYAKYTQQTQLATHIPELANGIDDFINEAGALWNRLTTKPTFQNISTPLTSTGVVIDGAKGQEQVLPSDRLRDSSFGALAGAFTPGTNILRAQQFGEDRGILIKTQGTIKVPGMPTATGPTVAPINVPNVNVQPTPVSSSGFSTPTTSTYTPPKPNYGGGGGGGASNKAL